jgi:hypothetical protein
MENEVEIGKIFPTVFLPVRIYDSTVTVDMDTD